MRLPTMRAMMSLGPPGGNGTISRIGRFGKSCARPGLGNMAKPSTLHRPSSKNLKAFTGILPILLIVRAG